MRMGLLKIVLCRIEANIYCGSMVNLRGPTSSIAKFFFGYNDITEIAGIRISTENSLL